jgi:hypothetical protein
MKISLLLLKLLIVCFPSYVYASGSCVNASEYNYLSHHNPASIQQYCNIPGGNLLVTLIEQAVPHILSSVLPVVLYNLTRIPAPTRLLGLYSEVSFQPAAGCPEVVISPGRLLDPRELTFRENFVEVPKVGHTEKDFQECIEQVGRDVKRKPEEFYREYFTERYHLRISKKDWKRRYSKLAACEEKHKIIFRTLPKDISTKLKKAFIDYIQVMRAEGPINAAAFLHQKFVEIHPLNDCNGRTARKLMKEILIANCMELPKHNQSDEDPYYITVQEALEKGWRIFADYLKARVRPLNPKAKCKQQRGPVLVV